jgi:hypothetical protein
MAAPSSGQREGPSSGPYRPGPQSSAGRHSTVRLRRGRGLVRGSDTYRSYDARNCAQWFARLEERSEGPKGRPSRSEVRRLQRELEALRRLVTGEQIP